MLVTQWRGLLRGVVRVRRRCRCAVRPEHDLGECPDECVHAVGAPVDVDLPVAHLVLEVIERADVVHLALFVQRGDGFGAGVLAAAGVHERDGHVFVLLSDDGFDQVATLVLLADDAVGFERGELLDGFACPLLRRPDTGCVGEHVRVPECAATDDDDAGLVAVWVGADGGIDRDDDAHQIGRCLHAVAGDALAGPQRASGLVEQLRIDLLLAEGGAFVLAEDLVEEDVGQVRGVVVRAATGHDRAGVLLTGARVFQQVADRAYRAGRGGDHDLRVLAQAQAEHQLVPRVGVLPRSHLVGPGDVVLRSTKLAGVVP